MIYRHLCPQCTYQAEDAEELTVCPDCASNEITNDISLNDCCDDDFCEGEEPEDYPALEDEEEGP